MFGLKHLWKWLMIIISLLLLIFGLLTFPLPLPIGLPIFLIGLALLARHSTDAKRWLIKLGKKYPSLGQLFASKGRKPPSKPVEENVD